ncbi:dTMP kinase [Endozoicomonas ascidiicola]|uniref:dTMP kinase n=1 Tax=Endozoicomonas ascidiicola TaxID=1698521 RepID=UPI000834C1AD|nr:hypothetical protein [Endozoicomonas ascidiicola]
MIVVFSGTDGAGKSTQIELLQSYLSSKNCKTKYLWARGGYTPLFSSVKNIARWLLRKKLPGAGESKERDQILNKSSVSSLWLFIAILDLLFFYGIYARYCSILGYVVICDRYLEDTCLDFKRNFSGKFNETGILWRALLLFAPKPNHSFLLYVPVEVSIERSKLKKEPFPDSPETLKWRLDYYLNERYFPSSRFCKIDCQQPVDTIQTIIRNHIEAV